MHLSAEIRYTEISLTVVFKISLGLRLALPKEVGISKIRVAQCLAHRTRDPAVAGSIPTTAHVVITLGKQFTYISSVHPSAEWVPGYRQLKCIDGY